MKPLLLKDPVSLKNIENAISLIHSNPNRPIQFPKDSFSKRRGAMNDASRLQMLITWARHAAKDSCLHFHPENNLNSVLEELCDYSPGIATLRLVKGVLVGNESATRREALTPATEKMLDSDAENFGKIIHGRSIDLICVSGSEVQYLKPLFYAKSSNAVKSKHEMQKFIQRLIKFINKKANERIPESLISALGAFTHELFLNTQEHATSNYKWEPYTEHVEGLIVSWKQLDEDVFSEDFSGNRRLNEFWRRELHSSRSRQGKSSLKCIEISFFDSGPGFVSRFEGCLTEDISLDKEREILMRCLGKNVSTKNQAGAGLGLPIVLEELRDAGGLIRIRSGRKSIFNSFAPGDKSISLFDFQDWSNDEMACVEGAVVSILIPLRQE